MYIFISLPKCFWHFNLDLTLYTVLCIIINQRTKWYNKNANRFDVQLEFFERTAKFLDNCKLAYRLWMNIFTVSYEGEQFQIMKNTRYIKMVITLKQGQMAHVFVWTFSTGLVLYVSREREKERDGEVITNVNIVSCYKRMNNFSLRQIRAHSLHEHSLKWTHKQKFGSFDVNARSQMRNSWHARWSW